MIIEPLSRILEFALFFSSPHWVVHSFSILLGHLAYGLPRNRILSFLRRYWGTLLIWCDIDYYIIVYGGPLWLGRVVHSILEVLVRLFDCCWELRAFTFCSWLLEFSKLSVNYFFIDFWLCRWHFISTPVQALGTSHSLAFLIRVSTWIRVDLCIIIICVMLDINSSTSSTGDEPTVVLSLLIVGFIFLSIISWFIKFWFCQL